MDPTETNLAVFQFVELLSIISFLCVTFVLFLLSYIRNKEKNRSLEEQNKKERLVTETITQVQENERSRISRDLHDTVTQDIRTALLYTHKLMDSSSLPEEQKALLEKIQQIEEENLKNIRNIIRNLTPGEIESASITQLLQELCENVNQAGGIQCKFYARDSELFSKIATEQKLHIFRIVQESINNAIKHSGASEISVILRAETDSADKESSGLLFMISDDGRGIPEALPNGDTPQKSQPAEDIISQSTHLGIKGMKSRATLLGAKLEIKSDQETGTQVKLFLKL
ncbi:MAG: sensor histidine kinase [Treponema sp.]|nr:sensor histidine kinase [Treponema sp.]